MRSKQNKVKRLDLYLVQQLECLLASTLFPRFSLSLVCPWVIPREVGTFIWVDEPDGEQTRSSNYFPCSEQSGMVLLKHDMDALSVKDTIELTEGVPLFG